MKIRPKRSKAIQDPEELHLDNTYDNTLLFIWFGGYSRSKTPGPIPNPAVKCPSADGTASQDVGE